MFSARRKPKRINRDEPERGSNDDDQGTSAKHRIRIRSDIVLLSRLRADNELEVDDGPVVRRPTTAPKTKSTSKLRTSLVLDDAEDSSDVPVVVKTKPRLGHNISSQSLPRFSADSRTQDGNALRPSYSKSALEELRNSTPSTPKDLSVYDPSSSGAEDGIRSLDIASKFGPQATSSSNAIPTAAEIAEKKSRRARLAKEQAAADFIPLEDDGNDQLYDSDGEFKPRRMQVSTYLRPEREEADTRLIHEDEDVMEGFDDYTEDVNSNRITMGRKQLLQAQRQDREAMRHMIEHAEGGGGGGGDGDTSGSSDSDSEAERNRAYETSQTAHGMDGLVAVKAAQRRAGAGRDRPRPPREVTPVPKLAVALGRLRERIARVELERVKVERRREEIRRERAEVVASQEHIQRSLTEAGEELRRLQERQRQEAEAGMLGVEGRGTDGGNGPGIGSSDVGDLRGRGLDTIGLTPEPT